MLPYIVINGKSSKTVQGLLIQALPPITKPKIRTSLEEIDGKDGDTATILGYSAYDKTLSIGLKGDYNVDDVISYFQTSGKITFSNEIDKYYKFSCYDAIDFNRLIRYKTANVNLHVQPFKYSIEEPPIKWGGSGTIAKLAIRNTGNIYSRPKITIKGSGNITVYLGKQIFSISLGESETIIIDSEDMNATDGNGNYLNRKVTGDYNEFRFVPGINNLTVTGDMERVVVENYSRWI